MLRSSQGTRERGNRATHGVEQDGEEELASINQPVQLPGPSRVLAVEDGVGEEAARLSGQYLQNGGGGTKPYGTQS